jgi:hypothetical protein
VIAIPQQLRATPLARYYPFTVAGSIVLAIGVVFVARGTAIGDVYRATLGVLAIMLPVLLGIIGRVQAGRFSDVEISWRVSKDTAATMSSPDRCGHIEISARGIRPWFFFRLHAKITGPMQVGRNARFHFHEEIATADGEHVRIPLPFPLPGKAQLNGRLEIRDVFGLTRARLGTVMSREVVAPSAMPLAPELTRVVAQTGGEESTRLRSPEEERYYMREYIPGDRLRDINWKASSRVRQLYARVSPETQEQSRTLTVYLRNFADPSERSIEALAHGAYIKGWMIAFLRTLLREEPDITFRVVTSRGTVSCSDEDEIDKLSWDLADLWTDAEPIGLTIDKDAHQVVVFSTPFDSGLDSFASRLTRTTIHLFATQLAGTANGASADPLAVHTNDTAAVFFGGTIVPASRFRMLARDRSLVRTCPSGADMIEAVDLRLVYDRRSYERNGSQGVYR